MFTRESEMTPSVSRWLKKTGLTVRAEFQTPWGICDLVGLKFNQEQVDYRNDLKQRKAISSISRAAILLSIPDFDTTKSISLKQLAKMFSSAISYEDLIAEVDSLCHDRFVVRNKQGRFQKVNGWFPLQERLLSVELKLNRIDEAFQQAKQNLSFATESFVAFPMSVARRVSEAGNKWDDYFKQGIGLMGVNKRGCQVLSPAIAADDRIDMAVQLYCVEKFWRRRNSD